MSDLRQNNAICKFRIVVHEIKNSNKFHYTSQLNAVRICMYTLKHNRTICKVKAHLNC